MLKGIACEKEMPFVSSAIFEILKLETGNPDLVVEPLDESEMLSLKGNDLLLVLRAFKTIKEFGNQETFFNT